MKQKLNCENCPWYSFALEQCTAPFDPRDVPECWVDDEEVSQDG